MPSRPSSVGGYVPILPRILPPLVRRPTARRRLFCARVQQGGAYPKTQNRRKGHLKARRAVLSSGSVLIFPRPKTPHRGRQRPAQGIKQPRPTPSWSKPGYCHLLRAIDNTAQRSLSASHQEQRGPRHFMAPVNSGPAFGLIDAEIYPDIIIGQNL